MKHKISLTSTHSSSSATSANYGHFLPGGHTKYVAVKILTMETIYVVVHAKTDVRTLYHQVCAQIGLTQTELFGMAICTSENEFMFLDPSVKLNKYAPRKWTTAPNGVDETGKLLFSVHLRVQYFVDSHLYISDPLARHLVYLQLKSNLVIFNQTMTLEKAFLLASYALRVDFGHYDADRHERGYFEAHHYFPEWVINEVGLEYIANNLPKMHSDLSNLSTMEAESSFIKEASDPNSPHNMHLYRLLSDKKSKNHHSSKSSSSSSSTHHLNGEPFVWLAICPNGIEIYKEELMCTNVGSTLKRNKSTMMNNGNSGKLCLEQSSRPMAKVLQAKFLWPDIGKLCFDGKLFQIRSVGSTIRKFNYYCMHNDMSRHLLWLCETTHRFQMSVSQKMKNAHKKEETIQRRQFRESLIFCGTNGSMNTSTTSHKSAEMSSSMLAMDIIKIAEENCKMKLDEADKPPKLSSSAIQDPVDQRVSVFSSNSSSSGIASDKQLSCDENSSCSHTSDQENDHLYSNNIETMPIDQIRATRDQGTDPPRIAIPHSFSSESLIQERVSKEVQTPQRRQPNHCPMYENLPYRYHEQRGWTASPSIASVSLQCVPQSAPPKPAARMGVSSLSRAPQKSLFASNGQSGCVSGSEPNLVTFKPRMNPNEGFLVDRNSSLNCIYMNGDNPYYGQYYYKQNLLNHHHYQNVVPCNSLNSMNTSAAQSTSSTNVSLAKFETLPPISCHNASISSSSTDTTCTTVTTPANRGSLAISNSGASIEPVENLQVNSHGIESRHEEAVSSSSLNINSLVAMGQDLGLPLITALCSDRSLMVPKEMSDRPNHAKQVRRFSCSLDGDMKAASLSGQLNRQSNLREMPPGQCGMTHAYSEMDAKERWSNFRSEQNIHKVGDFIERLWEKHGLAV